MKRKSHEVLDKMRPPQVALRFLHLFLRAELVEEVEGDLEEKFRKKLEESTVLRAKMNYTYQVLHYLRPFAIKDFSVRAKYDNKMWKQNLKVSWRSLAKRKKYTLINIGGLSLGIMATILIGLWVHDELKFDRQYEHIDQIVQVMTNQHFGDAIQTSNSQPMQLAPVLRGQYGQYFDHVVTASYTNGRLLSYGNKNLVFPGNFMEPGIAHMLSLRMIYGGRNALEEPSHILLSRSTAQSIFGQEDPLGKALRIDNRMDVQVAGVYADLPENSTFGRTAFIASWDLFAQQENFAEKLGWGNNWFQVLAQLSDDVSVMEASHAIRDVRSDHLDAEYAARTKPEMFLFPMAKWRLYNRFEDGINTGGRIEYIWIFGIIGVFILLLACINFMNLSTARSERRAKEVGIRKTIGSARGQLISQFMTESFLMVVLAYVLAIFVSWVSLPIFNQVTDKEMAMPFGDLSFLLYSLGFIFITSVIAGSYPAFYLSSFKPVRALKSLSQHPKNIFTLRRVLVTAQFVVSISLIIGTLVIFRQIDHAKNRPVGYEQEHVLSIPIKSPEIMKHFGALRQELMATGDVVQVAASDVTITSTHTTNSGFYWQGKDPGFSESFYTLRATHDFGDLIGWEIVDGRDFSREYGTDSLAFIVNETAVQYMGLKDPVGTTIQWGKGPNSGQFKVIGVIKDMITRSPYDAIPPMIYVLHDGRFIRYINAKINPGRSAHNALASIERIWKKYDPVNPFEFQFADEAYANSFKNEERLAKLASYFALLAIIISCMGLLGISALVTEQRKKEIGVRKILGASLSTLWLLVSREFLLLVLISSCFAIPVAYYYMEGWLENFRYHVELEWWIFATGSGIALIITLCTVSFNTIGAALASPMNALRHE